MSNYLDTRSLYKRQCELQEELDDLESERDDAQEAYNDTKEETEEVIKNFDNEYDQLSQQNARDQLFEDLELLDAANEALSSWKEENKEELDALNDLEIEVGREWTHGTTLIHEDDFNDYAQDCAEDMGMDRNQPWPYSCIDWDRAVDELRQDYTEVDFQGETYLFRS